MLLGPLLSGGSEPFPDLVVSSESLGVAKEVSCNVVQVAVVHFNWNVAEEGDLKKSSSVYSVERAQNWTHCSQGMTR